MGCDIGAVRTPDEVLQVVGADARQGRIAVCDQLAVDVAQRGQVLRVLRRATHERAAGHRHRHGQRAGGVDQTAQRQRRGQHPVPRARGQLGHPLIGRAVRADVHIRTAPELAATGGDPDLGPAGGQAERRLEDDRRRDRARRLVVVDPATGRRLRRRRHDLLRAQRAVFGLDLQFVVVGLVDRGDAHCDLRQPLGRVSQRDDVHDLEPVPAQAEPERVGVAHRGRAVAAEVGQLLGDRAQADLGELLDIGRQHAEALDRAQILALDRGRVVLVGAVAVLDLEVVLDAADALALDAHDRAVALRQQIVLGQLGDGLGRRRVGRAVAAGGGVAVGHELQLAVAPEHAALGDLGQRREQRLGFLLVFVDRAEEDAVGRAEVGQRREIAQPGGCQPQTVDHIGHQRGDHGLDPGIGLGIADAGQRLDLEGVLLDAAARAQVHRRLGGIGQVAVRQRAAGVVRGPVRVRGLSVGARVEVQAQAAERVLLLVGPDLADARDGAAADGHDHRRAVFVGRARSAAALAALLLLLLDGLEVVVLDDVRGDTIGPEHPGHGAAEHGGLDLHARQAGRAGVGLGVASGDAAHGQKIKVK